MTAKHLLVTIRIVGVSQIHHQAFCGRRITDNEIWFHDWEWEVAEVRVRIVDCSSRKLAHVRKEYLAFPLAAKASGKFQLSSLRKACRTENQRRLVLNNLRLLSARFELGIV